MGVVFLGWDETFWDSFENETALVIAKVWGILVTVLLTIAILVATDSMVTEGYSVELTIGIHQGLMLLSTIYEPVIAMVSHPFPFDFFSGALLTYIRPAFCILSAQFFHKAMVKRARRPSYWARCTSAVFGSPLVVSPKYVNTALWGALFIRALVLRDGSMFQLSFFPEQ